MALRAVWVFSTSGSLSGSPSFLSLTLFLSLSVSYTHTHTDTHAPHTGTYTLPPTQPWFLTEKRPASFRTSIHTDQATPTPRSGGPRPWPRSLLQIHSGAQNPPRAEPLMEAAPADEACCSEASSGLPPRPALLQQSLTLSPLWKCGWGKGRDGEASRFSGGLAFSGASQHTENIRKYPGRHPGKTALCFKTKA